MSSRRAAWCLLLGLLGMACTAYLYSLHLGLLRGELLGGAVCSGAGALNCHAVTASRWGSFLGIPLALWGFLGYVAVFALALAARQSPEWSLRAATLIAGLAAAFVAADLALFALMVFVIRYLCVFCLATYFINLALLVTALASLPPPRGQALGRLPAAAAALLVPGRDPTAALVWGLLFVGAALVAGVHAASLFLSQGSLAGTRKQMEQYVVSQSRVTVQTDRSPRLGSAEAPLQIAEFSDFLCPACQRASKLNKIFLASHRQDASFVFKHYPLDQACNDQVQRTAHPGACRVAAAAACAHLQGRFWPLHDLLFAAQPPYDLRRLDRDAASAGLDTAQFGECLASGRGMELVKRDIAEAGSLEVRSTPTYIVNGVRVASLLTPATLEELVSVLREAGP